MDRDDFVRDMLAALSSKKQDDAAWRGRERTAEEVFRQLSFDMPNVSQTDLETLTAALRTWTLGEDDRGAQEPLHWLCMQPTVVENVLFLASQHENSASSQSGVRPLQVVASQLCAVLL